jgi:hypothetical protein
MVQEIYKSYDRSNYKSIIYSILCYITTTSKKDFDKDQCLLHALLLSMQNDTNTFICSTEIDSRLIMYFQEEISFKQFQDNCKDLISTYKHLQLI